MDVSSATYNIKFSRVKNFFLGKEIPGIYTQLIFITGAISFLWFFSWNLLNLLALHMIENEDKMKHLKMIFYELRDHYGVYDVFTAYYLMVMLSLAGSGIMLIGLLFTWRKKIWASYLFLAGQTICLLSPILFMGISFFLNEMHPAEYFGPFLIIILFTIEIWLRRRTVSI